ncbi:hypothetical protein BN1180_02627 [Peribacillus simplex]|uniref:Uncharacterized protein n=1 Tax=Peribacillus simplex TaxID=1478 RepID=A0AAN2PHK5_9BACI|nr:hypothetical protein BN1180_02627 [Peribacillus simplex]
MEGSIVYSQSEFIQVFFKKGTISHSIAKLVPELLEFQVKNPFCTLIQERIFYDAAHQFFIVGNL